ncbi:MAG: aminopeptidase, partial [Gammaproteobacteria bacterium]
MKVRVRIGLMGAALALLASVVMPGCASIGYYSQAVQGHLRIMAAREPIDELLAEPQTPSRLKNKLRLAADLRAFAVRELALPDDGSYSAYVDTGRPYVTWTVVATPALSLAPRQWCFPVAGCVSYRGYFAEPDARDYAQALEREGMDVHVSGVRAYSTLGWFDDPVLNTMLARKAYDLAGVLFHELAHRKIYAPGDSTFNESYAVAVERAGVRAWIASGGDAAMAAQYEAVLERRAQFLNIVLAARSQLEQVYAAERPHAWKHARKQAIFEDLKAAHSRLSERWGGHSPYRSWFEGPPNNAKLALVATYHRWVPAFEAMLAELDGDLRALHAQVERLARMTPEVRERHLEAAAAKAASLTGT